MNLPAAEVHIHEVEDELPSQTDSAQSYSGKIMDESNSGTASNKNGKILLCIILYGLNFKGFITAMQ